MSDGPLDRVAVVRDFSLANDNALVTLPSFDSPFSGLVGTNVHDFLIFLQRRREFARNGRKMNAVPVGSWKARSASETKTGQFLFLWSAVTTNFHVNDRKWRKGARLAASAILVARFMKYFSPFSPRLFCAFKSDESLTCKCCLRCI